MNSLLKVMKNSEKFNKYIENVKKNKFPILLNGLSDICKAYFSHATKEFTDKPFVIITYNEMQAKSIIKNMKYFNDNVMYFPKREIVSYDIYAESKDVINQRVEVLTKICKNEKPIIITTIEAIMQKTITKELFAKNILDISLNSKIDIEEIKERLVNLGYERCDLIEGKGQFSIRGGIIDIFPTYLKQGIRIELWGDDIDSIRSFDISNQRSTEMIKQVTIYPAQEFLLSNNLDEIADKILKRDYSKKIKERVLEDIELIKSGQYLNKVDRYFDSFFENSATFLDYISNEYICFFDEVSRIKQRCETIIDENISVIGSIIEKQRVVPDAIVNMADYKELTDKFRCKNSVYLERLDNISVDIQHNLSKKNSYNFNCRELNFYRSSIELFFDEIIKAKNREKSIIILAGNTTSSKNISKLLLEKNIDNIYLQNLTIQLSPGDVIVSEGILNSGFECEEFNTIVISGEELFGAPSKKKTKIPIFKQGEKIMLDQLRVGDFVVHETHGVGEYIGVNTLEVEKIKKDFIKIKYRDGDILYIPTNSLDTIRKYIGSGDGRPKVNRMGGKEWNKTKTKVKESLRDIAKGLIDLYSKRQLQKGYAFSKDTNWQVQFEDNFPYQETDDQLNCIEEVKKDMEMERPMDRLLCGDVGYGKTEVAIRAAFKACIDGKQVAYLAPTTILSNQQYLGFRDRMKDFPIRVEVLNRFKTSKQQKEIIKKIKLGEIDVVIGTHRILQNDMEFKNLGLLIIDEEHRFGVEHKEKIKQIKTNVDVLTMTATPIPRTLHMSIVGIRDMSVIYEPPQNRRPVQTYVVEYDKEIIKEGITKELERDGQVFYLYNKVETIIQKASEIAKLVPEAKVAIAHGQMSGKELEEVMQEFVDKKINVLICTTILESGIDIPNANTIIVEDADRLGLAQLYQIRGRVGRSDRLAYAYVTYRRNKILSEIAEKRLKAIKEFTEFGSGYKIAMRDLEIRGSGNILGAQQHGHMEAVGYDMYCRLLEESVRELNGDEIVEAVDTQIDLNVSAYIPESYIENASQKIQIYQEIALCKTYEDTQEILDEVIDRYGEIPNQLNDLLDVAKVKILARKLGILSVTQKNNMIYFAFMNSKFKIVYIDGLMKKYKRNVNFIQGNNIITYTLQSNKSHDMLKEIEKLFLFLLEIGDEVID